MSVTEGSSLWQTSLLHTSPLQVKFVNSCHVVTDFALLFYSVTRVDSDLWSDKRVAQRFVSHGHFLFLLTLDLMFIENSD